MNSPNKYNVLFKGADPGNKPDGFGSARDYVSYLRLCCDKFQLPVKEYSQVISIEKENTDRHFNITVLENGSTHKYKSSQVVVATGCMNARKIPSFSENISSRIFQLHTSIYRSSSQLPEGNVLVIGSAQSGCQVAEDLADAGRKVYLSTSRVGRYPRRYRGKDFVDWLVLTGFFDLKTEDVTDPKLLTMTVPVVSGIDPLGHTLSYQLLSKKGVTILGRMENADQENVFLAPDAAEHVKFGDEFSQQIKNMVDEYISGNQIDAPVPDPDPADDPDTEATCASGITSLNFNEHNITSVIWTTGFNGDFSYLKMDVPGNDGLPRHKQGLSAIEGLYYIGLPWLRTRKSSNLIGINDDAIFIADTVAAKVK
jgi:putative flavoprotein involved in K+ transport